MKYPIHLLKVIEMLKRLPGVGSKSAERFAFQLIDWRPERLQEFADVIGQIPHKLRHCEQCGCIKGEDVCRLCDESRNRFGVICVVAAPKDVFAIEATREYQGLYHVLGQLLSPMEGKGAESLSLPQLRSRIQNLQIREMIIALDSTVEGDATAFYIKNEFRELPLKISRLAFGLPMGSSLEYVDGGTLARAFSGRGLF